MYFLHLCGELTLSIPAAHSRNFSQAFLIVFPSSPPSYYGQRPGHLLQKPESEPEAVLFCLPSQYLNIGPMGEGNPHQLTVCLDLGYVAKTF